jgi:hypothetical protein
MVLPRDRGTDADSTPSPHLLDHRTPRCGIRRSWIPSVLVRVQVRVPLLLRRPIGLRDRRTVLPQGSLSHLVSVS